MCVIIILNNWIRGFVVKIIEILKKDAVHMSCEIFPPKKWVQLEDAKQVVSDISKLKPDFISVTYGATGGTSEYTVS
jgi:Methylenetetrahydrofolate reductase.